MPYWPSYSEIDPRSRLAYLRWLAGGRHEREVGLGLVFLYFYGLERRLLGEGHLEDLPLLVAEVERLRDIYGNSRSFQRYSDNFLAAARSVEQLAAADPLAEPPEPQINDGWFMPFDVKVKLARRLATGEPLSGEWILAWYLGHPETGLRTPGRRAFELFCELFLERFAKQHPNGVRISPPKRTITIDYHAASDDFAVELATDIPDIASLKRPITVASAIAEACMDALDGYSRYLGRNPDGSGSLAALALMPEELLARAFEKLDGTAAALRKDLAAQTADGAAVLRVDQLLPRLDLATGKGKRMAKSTCRALGETLQVLGYGFEPDPDLGSPQPLNAGHVALFQRPAGPTRADAFGPHYVKARNILALAAAVAAADGLINTDERRHLDGIALKQPGLDAHERQRLLAFARWAEAEPPTLAELKPHLAGAPKAVRHALARFAIVTAAADDTVDRREVKLLERIYKLLELTEASLYSDLHALQSTSDAPATISTAKPEPGFAIPQPPRPEAASAVDGTIRLDNERIAAIRAETADVARLLDGVFAGEDEPPDVDEDEIEAATGDASAEASDGAGALYGAVRHEGLDAGHARFLDELLERDGWPRGDFERLARSHGLMAGGALETINEWAFERFDAPLLEGDESIEIDRTLLDDEAAAPLRSLTITSHAAGEEVRP